MTSLTNAINDVPLTDFLAACRLERILAMDQFERMEQAEKAEITNVLQRDGLNPFIKCYC